MCVNCKHDKNVIVEHFSFNEHITFEKKCLNVGLPIPIGLTSTEKKKKLKEIDLFFSKLKEKCPQMLYENILNKSPKIYPSTTKITNSNAEKHALFGRRFETSMLCFDVFNCECCGRISIFHDDNLLPKSNSNIINPRHFSSRKHYAWKCCCSGICNGEQFYCSKRPKQIEFYKQNHKGKFPWEFLHLPKHECNAILCDFCYRDIPSEALSRIFSFRNQFGPSFSNVIDNNDPNVGIAIELKDILFSMTCIEEAAIRQITPLISIVKLAHGNIGSKGNTTCMWNQSRLCTILPNLPNQCKYFVLSYKSKKDSDIILKSTKFEKIKIQRCLELLSYTVENVWKSSNDFKIEISQNNLDKWPLSGDIRHLDDVPTIPISEDILEKHDKDLDDLKLETMPNLYTDGNDAGPAPLQNKDFPEETFEAAIDTSNVKSSNIHDATIAQRKLKELLTPNETTGIIDQDDAIPLTEYVDMNKTPFSWARAFPTVFPPEYINGKWIIRHDITGSVSIRERNVNQNDWMEYLMWRSDGVPASHPTFSLVLYNHKIRNQLHKLGSVCLNTEDLDPNYTVEELKLLWENDGNRKNLQRKLFTYASNVPGTKPYWVAKCHEFKSTSFFHSYINQMHPTIFHTGTIAEYHDSWLRNLLSQYVSSINGNSVTDGQKVLNDNSHFTSAVQKYKHVVTHFLASKMEIWYNIVMKNIHNVNAVLISKEFASSRGSIHFHSLNHTDQSEDIEIKLDKCLVTLSISLYYLFKQLDIFICSFWVKSDQFKFNPALSITGKSSYEYRERFLKSFKKGQLYWAKFKEEESLLYKKYSLELTNMLESRWGYGALHPGLFPFDWVKPSGMLKDGYPPTSKDMLSSLNVLKISELKKIKSSREEDLLNRSINYLNHCGTHKCSNYCHVISSRTVKYNKDKHKHIKEDDIFNENGVMFARIKVTECRMKFGKLRIFDKSGENNLTRGIAIRLQGSIICDLNGQPRFHARRNHPRLLQQPHSFLYYGGNNDTQRLLCNRTGYKTCMDKKN